MLNTSAISVVDDDPSVREGLKDLLDSMGFAVRIFRSAEDFLASEFIDRTACLITDGRMSGITGFELHKQLLASGRSLPTILITAFPNDGDRTRAARDVRLSDAERQPREDSAGYGDVELRQFCRDWQGTARGRHRRDRRAG